MIVPVIGWPLDQAELMIELTGGGFAAVAAVLSFIAGSGAAQKSVRRPPAGRRRQIQTERLRRYCPGV
jgi:hypothetical protein